MCCTIYGALYRLFCSVAYRMCCTMEHYVECVVLWSIAWNVLNRGALHRMCCAAATRTRYHHDIHTTIHHYYITTTIDSTHPWRNQQRTTVVTVGLQTATQRVNYGAIRSGDSPRIVPHLARTGSERRLIARRGHCLCLLQRERRQRREVFREKTWKSQSTVRLPGVTQSNVGP